MSNYKSVTLIPARGGSKGIPKKNIIDVDGKPLLAYSIEASIKSNVDETWVSTDDDEIAKTAEEYGARVLKRPDEIARDNSTSESVLLHFIEKVTNFDILVFLQATCPFIEAKDINQSLDMIREFDSVISVAKFDQFLWSGKDAMYDIDNRPRRQDIEQRYVETGSMFVTSKECLIKSRNRISGKIGFVEVPKWRSIDIDTYEDLILARKVMNKKNSLNS